MNRLVVILLCVCVAVVCAFLAILGHQKREEEKLAASNTPPTVACDTLLTDGPADLLRLEMTDFKPGKHFAISDVEEDGRWEHVAVPFFPSHMKKLTQNYRAVIVFFADTKNKEELFAKIKQERLPAEYWSTSQNIDSSTYNQLAEKYSSLNFGKSVVLYSGYSTRSRTLGGYLFWGASLGVVLSVLVMGWQTLGLVIAGIKASAKDDETEDDEITNRAGLPTVEH